MQVLLYDDKEMHIWEVVNYLPQPPEMTEWDVTGIEDMFKKTVIIPKGTYTAEITTGEVKAELDPTTMKRIMRYNLEKDFEELNRQISKAKEKLLQLDKEMNTRREKIQLIDNLVEKIWEDEDFDEENYLPDENDDYEEGEWE